MQKAKMNEEVKGSERSDEEDDTVLFAVKLSDPTPEGVKISKKNICLIEIVPDTSSLDKENEEMDKLIHYFLEQ